MRALFLVLSDANRQGWAESVANVAGVGANAQIFIGTAAQAAQHLASHNLSPSHIVLDIGAMGQSVLPEVDLLAQQCEPGTRVIAVGDTNDVQLYRGLLARGVIDYLPMPAPAPEVVQSLRNVPAAASHVPVPVQSTSSEKRIMAFLSAASGDGASTAALNTAYALSQMYNGSTVIVDMDYQYGMVAKHIALQNQYGIKDLFDHPERGIDTTLIRRMVANYGKLHVITAPTELRYLPSVSAESVSALVTTLKQSYDNIVLDLPHVWLPWVAAACQQSTQIVLVAQLWLKSVSHAARMMKAFRELNIPQDRIHTIINRSGAKFKEAIDLKDFERVCGSSVKYMLSNDIRTVVAAEAEARTVMELEGSQLSNDIMRLARGLTGQPQEGIGDIGSTRVGASGLLARFIK